MDLNEKLAARRRELAIESEKTAQVDAVRARELAIQAEKRRQADREAIQVEVARRLAEKGIEPPVASPSPSPSVTPTPDAIVADKVNAEVETAITQAAVRRMTSGENARFFILLAIGVSSLFFVAWWLGLLIIAGAFVDLHENISRCKEQVIAEGKAKIAESKPKVTEEQIEWK